MKSTPAQAKAAVPTKFASSLQCPGAGKDECDKMEHDHYPADEPKAGNRFARLPGHRGKCHGQQRNCANIGKFAPIHQGYLLVRRADARSPYRRLGIESAILEKSDDIFVESPSNVRAHFSNFTANVFGKNYEFGGQTI